MRAGLLALLACAAIGAGCSGAGASTPSTIRSNVARQVLQVMNRQGMPVESDSVGCDGPDPSGLVSCAATTTDTPVGNITAAFTVRHQRGGCPGPLTVRMNGTLVNTVTVNPCV